MQGAEVQEQCRVSKWHSIEADSLMQPQAVTAPSSSVLLLRYMISCWGWQVWNTNHCGGVVGVFNVQGASWSRTKHVFVTHDPSPPPLEAVVRPQDVAPFAGGLSSGSRIGV